MTVLLTLTSAGTDSGPFDLYTDLDSYTTPFESGITRNQLLAGYNSTVVPDGALIVRAKSEGNCINYLDMPLDYQTTTSTTTLLITTTTTTTSLGPTFNGLVSVVVLSGESMALSWAVATQGAAAIDYYEIYVDGAPVAQTSNLFYTITDLYPNNSYTIFVRVVDTGTAFDDSPSEVDSTQTTRALFISAGIDACAGIATTTVYWNGGTPINPSNGLPTVGSTIWSDAGGTSLYTGAGPGVYYAIAIDPSVTPDAELTLDGGSVVTVVNNC